MLRSIAIREAAHDDLPALLRIYNDGIDRVATLDVDPNTAADMAEWWGEHADRYGVVVANDGESTIGWASLNPFSHRCAHSGIADLSIYVSRSRRGQGIGSLLLARLIERAQNSGFHKIVLHALNDEAGKRLYRLCGFREVGIFREHGMLEGKYVDVVAMEHLLK